MVRHFSCHPIRRIERSRGLTIHGLHRRRNGYPLHSSAGSVKAFRLSSAAKIAVFCAMFSVVLPAAASDLKPNAKPIELRNPARHFNIPKLTGRPTLADFDGMAASTELSKSMLKLEKFVQRDPKDGAPASQRTEVYVGYTDKNFYMVFLAFDTDVSQIRAHMNRREDIQQDDQVGAFIDTMDDRNHAYTIYVNPLGIQQDGIFSENGDLDLSWDTLWYSSARLTPEGYVAWFEIPFKSLRFPKAPVQQWGIFFERDIPRNNESAFYPAISNNQQGLLTQEAQMLGMTEISPGRNMQFIPYGSFSSFRSLDQRDPAVTRFSQRTAQFRAGLDSKVVLHDSLVFDTTVNPDFAQVESDEPQTTVNQRFEVYFPEKRPFFLENAGYFETPINLVFTRRLIDPSFGLRMTGKIGKWGIGTLLADDRSPGKSVTAVDPLIDRRAYFGIVRVTHDIGKNSRVGVIYTDRELETDPATTCTSNRCVVGFNRIGGVDGRWKISEKWVANFQALASSTKYNDGTRSAGPAYKVYVERSSNKLEFNSMYLDNSPGFLTEVGFFQRPDIRRFSNFLQYRFRKNGKKLVWHGPQLFTVNLWDHTGLRLEYSGNVNYRWVFKRQTQFGIYANIGHERLRPVDFSALPGNVDYTHNQRGFFFSTGFWKQLSLNSEVNWGVDTNYSPPVGPPVLGKSNYVQAGMTWRPVRGMTVENSYLLSRLRDNVTGTNIFNAHIIRSKINYQFTRELSLRVIGQYDSVISNPLLTTLTPDKNVNADFLFTYLLHPGTAIYVGYNSNLHNYDRSLLQDSGGLIRSQNGLINDGRQVFVKVSYMFRY
jgi:hypothetical protein